MTQKCNRSIRRAVCLVMTLLLFALSVCGTADEIAEPTPALIPTPTQIQTPVPTVEPTPTATSAPMQSACKEIRVYPEEAYYCNEELGIAVNFPESWAGHLMIEEVYCASPAIRVYCREAADAQIERTGFPEYANICYVVSANRNNPAEQGHLKDYEDDPSRFIYLNERDGIVYYLSDICSFELLEIFYNEVWAENEEILTEILEQRDNLADRIEILVP